MLCPKCSRPLDDEHDADHVCCANANLQWRCMQCGEVSVGFALPYGRCPHCSGMLESAPRPAEPAAPRGGMSKVAKPHLLMSAPGPTTTSSAPRGGMSKVAKPHLLMRLDGRRADEAAALAGIRMAFEIELGGRAFYQRAAGESDDPVLRDLFGRFAQMEGEHMEALSRRYHVDVPEPSQAFKVELAAIFANVEHRPQEPANLFRIAIAIEQRAAEFFTERAAVARPGSAEQRLYRELAAEELEHSDTLSVAYMRWREGRLDRIGGAPRRLARPRSGQAAATINAAALLLEGHDAARTALACGGERVSYGALRDSVARAASVWRARGVAPGDRVAIKLSDGVDWVSAYLGAIWAGGVAVAVNPRIPPGEWQYILDEAGFAAILAESRDDTPSPWCDRVVLVDEWRHALAEAPPLAPAAMDLEAPAFWCHSSGTSGKPKAVVHGQRFAQRIEQVSREGLGIRADDRLYASSKLFFAYPHTNSLCAGLKLGATVVLDAQWPTADSVVATVESQRPTVLLSVPSLYRNLLHEGLAPRIAHAGVRLCVSAGESLPASLRDAWREQTGLTIVNGYGASEVLILVMLDHGDAQGFTPSPGVEIGPLEAAPDGAPTRLAIRAPTLALGYLDRPQAQAETFRDGAFCPADLFAHNEAGGWRFAGREDSLVKIRGRWVNLVELEDRLLAQSAGIAEAAAVCVPDRDGVEAVAFFFVASDAAAAAAALRARADTLPPYQRPQWLHAVATLPRGPTGKLLRRKLQELHHALG